MKDPDGQLEENADEAALRCLNCDYNLTGLSENRCPECGLAFDPDRLRSTAVLPATPWDRRPGIAGFLATWWMAAASPRVLARGFPCRHSAKRARQYSACCYAIAVLVFLSPTAFGIRSVEYTILICTPVAWIAASILVEVLIASGLVELKPIGMDRAQFFWRGLAHYGSGFSIFTGAVLAGAFTGVLGTPLLALSAVGTFAWWSVSLMAMIGSRMRPGDKLAAIWVPYAGLCVIVLVFAICMALVVMTFAKI